MNLPPTRSRALKATLALALGLAPGSAASEAAEAAFVDDPGATWVCDPEPGVCVEEYLAFLDRAAPHATIRTGAELRDLVDAAGTVAPSPQRLRPRDLAALIVDATGIGFLVDDLASASVSVRRTAQVREGGVLRQDFLVDDRWVGTFALRVIAPDTNGPAPAVLALHGHSEAGPDILARPGVRELVARGYVVAAPTFRVASFARAALPPTPGKGANEAPRDTAWESMLTRLFLLRGQSLLGVRVYEALVALRCLRALPEVDAARVAVLGHSGGPPWDCWPPGSTAGSRGSSRTCGPPSSTSTPAGTWWTTPCRGSLRTRGS